MNKLSIKMAIILILILFVLIICLSIKEQCSVSKRYEQFSSKRDCAPCKCPSGSFVHKESSKCPPGTEPVTWTVDGDACCKKIGEDDSSSIDKEKCENSHNKYDQCIKKCQHKCYSEYLDDLHKSQDGPGGSHSGPGGSHSGPGGSHSGPGGSHSGPGGSHSGPGGSHSGPGGSHSGPGGSHSGPGGSHGGGGPGGSQSGPGGSQSGPGGSQSGPGGSQSGYPQKDADGIYNDYSTEQPSKTRRPQSDDSVVNDSDIDKMVEEKCKSLGYTYLKKKHAQEDGNTNKKGSGWEMKNGIWYCKPNNCLYKTTNDDWCTRSSLEINPDSRSLCKSPNQNWNTQNSSVGNNRKHKRGDGWKTIRGELMCRPHHCMWQNDNEYWCSDNPDEIKKGMTPEQEEDFKRAMAYGIDSRLGKAYDSLSNPDNQMQALQAASKAKGVYELAKKALSTDKGKQVLSKTGDITSSAGKSISNFAKGGFNKIKSFR